MRTLVRGAMLLALPASRLAAAPMSDGERTRLLDDVHDRPGVGRHVIVQLSRREAVQFAHEPALRHVEVRGYGSTKTTNDDLRGRPLKDGNMDVYQWLLMISSHSQRHILQIREIKASSGFPAR